jgi:Ca2+-binding EF-hand superfamily protein
MAGIFFGFIKKAAAIPVMQKAALITVPALTATGMAHSFSMVNDTFKMDSLSCEDRDALFNEIDTDGDGFIDRAELQSALSARGLDIGLRAANALMCSIDTDHDGHISKDEFMRLHLGYGLAKSAETLGTRGMTVSQLNQMFDEIDTDHSGFLDQAELHAALCTHDVKIGCQLVTALTCTLDQNNDGLISRDEFLQLVGK